MKLIFEKPGFLSPYGNFGTDLSYLLAITFTVLFMVGWYQARQKKGQAHHLLTLFGMVAMLSYFVIYYLARELGKVALEGKEGFGGGALIYKWIFFPILNLHIIVVTIGIFLAVYMIVLGFRVSLKEKAGRILVAGPPALNLKQFSKGTLIISIALAAGLFLFRILFRPPSWGLFMAWFFLCTGGGFLLVLMEGLSRYFYPDGAERHRVLGTVTMSLYLTALFTSTLTYLMLYVFWPPVR